MSDASKDPHTTKGTNVQVAIRCRPPNEEEKKGNHASVVSCNQQNKQVSVNYGGIGKKQQKMFSFDKVFGMYSTQEEVFDSMVQPIVEETLAGFNCTIFAYGQTGTGKTHTMEGDIYSEENAGIVPRSVRAILEQLETKGSEFTIRVSFLELYNEELQDLLTTDASAKDKGALRLCEDVKKGVVCQNLEEITVLNVNDIFEILKRGIKQRQTAATLCNKNSSRSHSIFTMKIMIKEMNVEGEEVIRNGQLNLVDLAGSECVGRSGAKNARAREAGSINQSLLTLGRVITALVDHHGHIPYRDSKLTRLLQESLGGKAKTCIIATLSPSQLAVEESLSTLDYASKAKSIKNVPQVNQKMTKKTVMKEYCAEIESLRNMLQITREKNGIYVDPATFENMESRLTSQELQITECESVLQVRNEEIKTIRTEVDAVKEKYEEAKTDLDIKTVKLADTEKSLNEKAEEAKHFETEWQASEAVVLEQDTTEQSLSTHVKSLQENVSLCNNDLTGLFGKIDRHANKEKERIEQAEKFSADIDSKQTALISSFTNSLSKSQVQSKNLCEGVGSMLSKGKNVCSEFEESIARALVVLVGDTTVAKDSMVESCTDLNNTLSGTQNEVIESLKAIQQNFSSWLGEVQTNMNNTQEILTRQQASLEEFKTAIESSNQEFKAKNDEFVSVQKEFSSSLISDMTSLKTDIATNVGAFKTEIKQNADKNKAELKKKRDALQKAMTDLLGDLVESQEDHSNSVVTSTNDFSSQITTVSNSGVDRIVESGIASNSAMLQLNTELSRNVEKSAAQFSTMVEGTQLIGQEIEREISCVGDSVGDKRDFLETTTTTLSASVSKSIGSARDEVNKTSTTAEKMVDNVTDASNKMKSSCAESMNSFTEFLSGKGEEINSELIGHFKELEGTLMTDMETVKTVSEDNSGFLELTRGSVLQPTGTTPVKKAPIPAKEVERTRPHDDIKQETRSSFTERSLEEPDQDSSIIVEESSDSFMSPSKAAKLSELVQQVPIPVDMENIAPANLSVNIGSASIDDDDDQSACSKSSVSSSQSSGSVTSRGVKRVSGTKSGIASPKLKRTSSKVRSSSTRAVL